MRQGKVENSFEQSELLRSKETLEPSDAEVFVVCPAPPSSTRETKLIKVRTLKLKSFSGKLIPRSLLH